MQSAKEHAQGLMVIIGIALTWIYSDALATLWAALALVAAFLSWQDRELYKMLNERIAALEDAEHRRKYGD